MGKELELQRRVIEELDWEPSIDAAHVGVAVTGQNVVTLTGNVSSYAEKIAAERAAKRVTGVKAVANDLEVRPAFPSQRNDTELAKAALNALEWDIAVPHDKIKVRVSSGVVALEGEVNFQFQRSAAEEAVRRLIGVKAVTNLMTLKPTVSPADIKNRIEAALRRSAEIDAKNIQVETKDGGVVLRGKVRSWIEREEAERAAWAAPGVRNVDDELRVGA